MIHGNGAGKFLPQLYLSSSMYGYRAYTCREWNDVHSVNFKYTIDKSWPKEYSEAEYQLWKNEGVARVA
jgi:hypothetical protein